MDFNNVNQTPTINDASALPNSISNDTSIPNASDAHSQKKYTTYRFMSLMFFLCFGIYSLLLSLFSGMIARKSINSDSEVLSGIFHEVLNPFVELSDERYLEIIDEPLEEIFHSPEIVGYIFSTSQYPPSEELKSRVQSQLASYSQSCSAVLSSFIYTSTLDSYLADWVDSAKTDSSVNQFYVGSDSLYSNLIYSYNSNTVEKSQIQVGGHLTFLFRFQNYLVLAKDLTTVSGQSYATIFALMEPQRLVDTIFSSASPTDYYRISAYDQKGTILFVADDAANLSERELAVLAASKNQADFSSETYRFYMQSDVLHWQYVLETSNSQLYETEQGFWQSILFQCLLALILAFITVLVLTLLYKRKIMHLMELLEFPTDTLRLHFLSDAETKLQNLIKTNNTLESILSATPAEAVYSLFSLLIIGQKVEPERIDITLNNSGYGFHPNDIYVAGIIQHTQISYLDTEARYRILNLANITFDKFKEKHNCNIFVFSCDANRFAVIVSFDASTSIAKGKSRVNRLTEYMRESFEFAGIPLTVAFGHMYNSILDLYFSYNEAVNVIALRTSNASDVAVSNENSDISIDSVQDVTSVPMDFNQEHTFVDSDGENEEDILSESSLSELIERRTHQIADMVYQDKQEGAFGLIDRSIHTIMQLPDASMRAANCKRLVSALTDSIISYPYMTDSNLSDVYSELAGSIEQGITDSELEFAVRAALTTLCEDFHEVLKKQNNPYIISAMDYIAQNYSNPDLSLEEIAEHLQIAPNYLSTIFSKNLGKKLFEYVNEYRLERSIELLLNTNKMITDISIESGFGSSRNYIRIFKKYKDTTPGNYRKQHLSSTSGTQPKTDIVKELTEAAKK